MNSKGQSLGKQNPYIHLINRTVRDSFFQILALVNFYPFLKFLVIDLT